MSTPNISFIANSGVQFYQMPLSIDPNADHIRKIGFWEKVDMENSRYSLEYAKYIGEYEMWASQRQLEEDGFLYPNGQLREDVTPNLLTPLDPEKDCYSINDVELYLEKFEDQWLPIPYFHSKGDGKFVFGPTNWCRIKLIPVNSKGSSSRTRDYTVILLFDTSISVSNTDNESPSLPEQEYPAPFMFCSDPKLLLNFCDDRYGCGWVQEYLDRLVHGDSENLPTEFPVLKHIGYYLYLLKYLSMMEGFPKVYLNANEPENAIEVDMVLDIGNSRTCGILMETPKETPFSFDKVKKLAIRDLSNPVRTYVDPFDMRLAFRQAKFGEIGFNDNRFVWPSFIRVGEEAFRLIHKHQEGEFLQTAETLTNHSSPKRYLWDDQPSNMQWRLIDDNGISTDEATNNSIYIRGISEQFTKDGTLAKTEDEIFGVTNNFSRKSLMTFVFMEILAHAMVQVNSFEFRKAHGNRLQPRRIRHLAITCPTAMSQAEQITLRQCAEDASLALTRFFSSGGDMPLKTKIATSSMVKIIPQVKDLKKDLSRVDEKKDWIYDEATCCQLVFIYAEISKRYLNICDKFFDLYGRVRSDLYNYNKKSITIGSVDIGGGTTDLMISSYKYDNSGIAVLTPVPLFWESFYMAGDQLTKEIVKQIILEGELVEERFRGCTGVITNTAREKGIEDIESKLNNFFGPKSNEFDYERRQIRRKFNIQVSIPIAERYLDHAQADLEDTLVTFKDLFPVHQPNKDVLDYFANHFGFRFEEIRWKLSSERVNQIVQIVFEPLIRQICSLLFIKGCDFVLLAGRPTSLKKINDLILKYYPVSPDRIISLNEYRVGRWYPFQDGNGYFTNKKSIVAVGAAIAMYGGRMNALSGFRLNMEELKKHLTSTAEYFGIYEPRTTSIENPFITPELNKSKIQIDGLPINIGFKMLDAVSYPGRMLYRFDFDMEKIRERKKQQFPDKSPMELEEEIKQYIIGLTSRTPFQLRITREYKSNREMLVIDSIEDKNGDHLLKSVFQFHLQTLDDEGGYWLDTGEFQVRILSK